MVIRKGDKNNSKSKTACSENLGRSQRRNLTCLSHIYDMLRQVRNCLNTYLHLKKITTPPRRNFKILKLEIIVISFIKLR